MHCLIWPLITPWHRFQFRSKKRKLRKLNLPQGTQLGNDRTWKFSNLRMFVLKTTEDLVPHDALEALSLLTIWSEGRCESVWSRNAKGNSNAESRRHLNTEGKEWGSAQGRDRGKEWDRKLEPKGLGVEFGILLSTCFLTRWAWFPGPTPFCWLWRVVFRAEKKRTK